MLIATRKKRLDIPLLLGVFFLILYSVLILYSIAPYLFPLYFLFIGLAVIVLFIFANIDFEVISLFTKHIYIGSIIFLLLPLIIGQVSRGAVRWIPLGPLTIQPAEIVRPFLLIFFANFFFNNKKNLITIVKSFLLLVPLLFLILIQPSLGVTILTFIGYGGVFLASGFNKKYILGGIVGLLVVAPILFNILAPYQQSRILTFLSPSQDPLGAGYNSIQSQISIGSGGVFGEGLGKGIQTQLAFLPERQTDFVFASAAEELGLIGAGILLIGSFFILYRIIKFMEVAESPGARTFLAGLFLTLFAQTVVNIGMNLGLLPITGLPLPLVSAGGSSLIATMIGLGLAMGARKT